MTSNVPGTATIGTSAARGAVGTILLHGEGTDLALRQHFWAARRKHSAVLPLEGRIYFGTWNHGAESTNEGAGEEVVVARLGDCLELHCHGGKVAAQKIMRDLIAMGFEEIDWSPGDSTADDLLVSEALHRLPHALTTRCAMILVDQLNGALRQSIAKCLSLVCAERIHAAESELDALLQFVDVGSHLTQPWRVSIIGQPNVGKSSLLNAISGYDRAIVYDQPGTTRDLVNVNTAIDGWPFEFIDTAGIRTSDEHIERLGIERSLQAAQQADLVVLVADASMAWTDADQSLYERWADAIVVHNKSDLPLDTTTRPAGLQLSATTGIGLAEMMTKITERLVQVVPVTGQAVPFTNRQVSSVSAAREALQSGEGTRATTILKALLDRSIDGR